MEVKAGRGLGRIQRLGRVSFSPTIVISLAKNYDHNDSDGGSLFMHVMMALHEQPSDVQVTSEELLLSQKNTSKG